MRALSYRCFGCSYMVLIVATFKQTLALAQGMFEHTPNMAIFKHIRECSGINSGPQINSGMKQTQNLSTTQVFEKTVLAPCRNGSSGQTQFRSRLWGRS